MISREVFQKMVDGTRDHRVYISEKDFAYFAMYYFSDFFTYRIAGFHWLMYRVLNQFSKGKWKFLLWVMFRESAKTSITKMFVVWNICYRKKRFINWDAYDKGNAESALFDIQTWLQTNKKLIEDFGQLFYEDAKLSNKYAKIKRVSEFITTNKIKVKAYSTQESTRGRIYITFRPDLYVVDDFETFKTAESAAITAKIIAHIDELKSGLSVDGQVIFLCNYLTESGSVANLMAEAKANSDSWDLMKVEVEMGGDIMWEAKYVRTNEESTRINEGIASRKEWVVSLEQKKKDLNSGGRKIFETEMMNDPSSAGEVFFDREKVDVAIKSAEGKRPVREVGGFRIYEEYKPNGRYGAGGDTAKGVGRDSCTSVFIKFRPMIDLPAFVVGVYDSNMITPDLFGIEFARQGDMFGQCILCPEVNNTGYATVAMLKLKYPQHKIYRHVVKDQLGTVISDQLGWEARSDNVADIYYSFKTAFENGEIRIFDMKLLHEMRSFSNRDLHESSRKQEGTTTLSQTRHFDILRAACLAWQMSDKAVVSKPGKKYRQPNEESVSEYHG